MRLALILLLTACGPKKLETVRTSVGEPLVAEAIDGRYLKAYMLGLAGAIEADDMRVGAHEINDQAGEDGTWPARIEVTDHGATYVLAVHYANGGQGLVVRHGELVGAGTFAPEVSTGMQLWRERFDRWHEIAADAAHSQR